MNTLKRFGKTIFSVLTFNLYQERKALPGALTFGPAFRYLVACVALFSVIFAFAAFPVAAFLVTITGQLPSYFPEDLVVTIADGKASSNKNPYIIPMDIKTGQNRSQNTPKNFAVIDTTKRFTLNDFHDADTALYVASDYFGVLKNSGNDAAQVNSYNGFKLVLSRVTIQSFVHEALQLKGVLYSILPIVFFVGAFLGITISVLFISLISAALVLLYAKIRSIEIRYATAYALTLFMSTFALAIRIFFLLSGINPFTFFYTFLTAIMVVIALERDRAQAQPLPQQPQEPTQSAN